VRVCNCLIGQNWASAMTCRCGVAAAAGHFLASHCVHLEREQILGTASFRSLRFFGVLVEKAGPYLLLELLLPGGTLVALVLYVYRRQKTGSGARNALPRWSSRLLCRIVAAHFPDIASVWRGRHRERDGLEALVF
jgi:hypothetical protein